MRIFRLLDQVLFRDRCLTFQFLKFSQVQRLRKLYYEYSNLLVSFLSFYLGFSALSLVQPKSHDQIGALSLKFLNYEKLALMQSDPPLVKMNPNIAAKVAFEQKKKAKRPIFVRLSASTIFLKFSKLNVISTYLVQLVINLIFETFLGEKWAIFDAFLAFLKSP